MKPETRKAIALFGGATADVIAVGFSGDGDDKLPSSTTTTTTTSFGVTAAPTPAARPADPAGARTPASLRGCIIGLNCGSLGPKHPKKPRLPISQTPPPDYRGIDRWVSRELY
jgi:hypothetical protein